jgi:hypothetical protein
MEFGVDSSWCTNIEAAAVQIEESIWLHFTLKLQLLVPLIVYFLGKTFCPTHDCYECYNRLPGVRYSIFQFNRLEKNLIFEKRQGKGAVKIYNNLIKQA